MVYAAVRQIQLWMIRIGNTFSFIPGYKNIIGIINAVISFALNYIDETIVVTFLYGKIIVMKKVYGNQHLMVWSSLLKVEKTF